VAVVLALGLGLLASGCGDAVEGVGDGGPLLPEAGPDLLPGESDEDTCGVWAAYREGRTWTVQSRSFFGQTTTATTVDTFDEEDGVIVAYWETTGAFEMSGETEFLCDQDGLHTVRTFRATGWGSPLTETFDPPMLLAPRALAVGDEWRAISERTREEQSGTSRADVAMEYVVLAEQLISTPAGVFTALLVEATDLETEQIAHRYWRVPGIGEVMSVAYFDWDGPGPYPSTPGFLSELVSIEDGDE
jgi:hypothetical protein